MASRGGSDINPLIARMHVWGKERKAPTAQACALYARVSDDRQESLPVQLEHSRRYAARLGLPIAAEFADEESGLITTRHQYQALMTMARAGTISHVVVFHSSRFGREDGEYVTAARELERLGVELHTTTLGRIDPGMVGMHAMISNMEVRNISAHVLPNMIARAQRGLEMGAAHYGYRRTLQPGVREPDPDTFPIVQELFRRYAGGESLVALTAWFNARSGMHKRTHGVKKLLADPYYAGTYVYNRWRKSKIDGHYLKPRSEWIAAEHQHPATDHATWEAVQARLARNANVGQERAAGPRYALTGLLWCASCHKRMAGRPDQPRRYPIYYCPYCGKTKSTRKVESSVRATIESIPVGDAALARRLVAVGEQAERAYRAQAASAAIRLEKLTSRRARLTQLYADGELASADYHAALRETDIERSRLQAEGPKGPTQTAASSELLEAAIWLEAVTSWADLLDEQPIPPTNEVYRALIASCMLDFGAALLRITWTPAVALVLGASAHESTI